MVSSISRSRLQFAGRKQKWERIVSGSDFKGHREFDRFSMREIAFIAQRDSFYTASVSETGGPMSSIAAGLTAFSRSSMIERSPSSITVVIANISAPEIWQRTTGHACF
jgi:hypothetical protein